ncbi:MAG: DUF624 domain-containing protein [Lachnospiraceae bacterium]|nr:DUF624 domain-containing protein [Lachnospiraceae bacterium]
MNKIFDVDNKLFTALNKMWDLIILDLLWMLTVLLFVGPACTSLYYAIAKNIRRSRSYPGQTFWHSFKLNFKQAAIIGAMQIAAGLWIWYSYHFALAMAPESTFGQVYYWVVVFEFILFSMVSVYVYPVLSRFTMKTGKILKLSFYMSIRHFFSTTIYGVLGIVGVVLAWHYILFSPIVLVAPAIYMLVLSIPMEKVLRIYMPKKEDQDEATQDAWYYE